MARVTHLLALDEVARRIGENRELIEIVSANSDNIDYGDQTPEEAVETLLDGMESVGYTIG